MFKRFIIACAVLMPSMASVVAAPEPTNAQVMSISALSELYKGNTWLWPSGGAYFRANGIVIAYSGAGEKASYLEGNWGAFANGRFCFWGKWKAQSGSSNKTTCFRHAAKGEVLYQQNSSGEWYVFRSEIVREGDEINNVVGGDVVSFEFDSVKRVIDAEAKKVRQTRRKAASEG